MEHSSFASATQRLGASPLPMSSGARMVRSPQPVLCFCACALWGFFREGNVLAFLLPSPIFRKFFLRSNFSPPFCNLPSHCELCGNGDWWVSLAQDSHPHSSALRLGRLRAGPVVGLDGGKNVWTEGTQGLIPPVGSPQIENIQPFSAKDLSIRSLGDRIRDLAQLKNLYPKKPKDEAFRSHYKRELELAVLNPSFAHLFHTPSCPSPHTLYVIPDLSLHFRSPISPICPSEMPTFCTSLPPQSWGTSWLSFPPPQQLNRWVRTAGVTSQLPLR